MSKWIRLWQKLEFFVGVFFYNFGSLEKSEELHCSKVQVIKDLYWIQNLDGHITYEVEPWRSVTVVSTYKHLENDDFIFWTNSVIFSKLLPPPKPHNSKMNCTSYHGETNIRSHLDLEESGKPSYILIMEIYKEYLMLVPCVTLDKHHTRLLEDR